MVRQHPKSLPPKDDSADAYEATLRRALADRERVATARSKSADRLHDLDERHATLTALAQTLLPLLSPSRRARYAKELEGEQAQVSGNASPAYRNVIQLFAAENRREWTAPDMQEALKQRGIETELKPIHNAFNYLAREGKSVVSAGVFTTCPSTASASLRTIH